MPKFSRTNKTREAFMRSLARSLILNGRIITTRTRAKATKSYVEKLITKAKTINLSKTRTLAAGFGHDSVEKLLKNIVPALSDRKGGYTRVINLPVRKSDSSKMAIIEIIK